MVTPARETQGRSADITIKGHTMMEDFPTRQQIISKKDGGGAGYLDRLVEEVKSIDISKVDFDGSDFRPRQRVVEKQRVYRWTRLFVKEEVADLQVNDRVDIVHLPTSESLQTSFICYAKAGLARDTDGSLVSYDGEDDRKVLCLMIDTELLQGDSAPFLRTLFPNTPHYEYSLLRRDELVFENRRTGQRLDYFDVQF